jgi:hypothetical protein
MGLAPAFKQYIRAKFPECVSTDALAPVEGVVVDVMVILHSFKPDTMSEMPSGRQLCDRLFYAVWEYEHAVFCFDNTAQTPINKAIEWAKRADGAAVPADVEPTKPMDPAALDDALSRHELPDDFNAFLADRKLRMKVCEYLQDEMFRRMRMGGPASTLVSMAVLGARDVPSAAYWNKDDTLEIVSRSDLTAPMMGEADVSCISAAMYLRAIGANRVHVRTVDSDLVAVALLHAFPGMFISLPVFDRKKHELAHYSVDVHALANAAPKAYGVCIQDFVVILLSKKTDYTRASIMQLGEWCKYVAVCVQALKMQQEPLYDADDATLDLLVMHRMFLGATVGQRKNVKIAYGIKSWHLNRLAWVFWYYTLAPSMKTASKSLDPVQWGWTVKDVAGRQTVCENEEPGEFQRYV